ncbi:hypothetical protein TKK_0003881 [Trichogramma kaykai]
MPLVELTVVKKIAHKYNKSPAQILLRHLMQAGRAVKPKSADAQRQRENLDIFDFRLDRKDVLRLNDLDKGEHGRIFNFVALVPGVEKHPEGLVSFSIARGNGNGVLSSIDSLPGFVPSPTSCSSSETRIRAGEGTATRYTIRK